MRRSVAPLGTLILDQQPVPGKGNLFAASRVSRLQFEIAPPFGTITPRSSRKARAG